MTRPKPMQADQSPAYPYVWWWRVRLPERKGQPCRVTARGTLNSIRVDFPDGFWVITGRWGCAAPRQVMERTDLALHISQKLARYGFRPGGTFSIEAGQREDQFVVAATHGRLRPLLTEWHVVYTEPDSGREFACAAFGREERATEVVAILAGRLTSPNLGGYCSTARIPLVWVGSRGCYYRDLDGYPWASTDLVGCSQPCSLCGRLMTSGYSAATTDVLVCDRCVVHVDVPEATAFPPPPGGNDAAHQLSPGSDRA